MAVARRTRVAAYGIAERDGSLLLVRASPASSVPGTWWLPGGGLEFGETPEDGVVREVREETGLDARVRTLLAVCSDVVDRPDIGERLHSIRVVFAIDLDDGEPRPETGGSSDAVEWVPAGGVTIRDLAPWVGSLLRELRR